MKLKPLIPLLKQHDAELQRRRPDPRLQARLAQSLAAHGGARGQRTSGWLLASASLAVVLCGVVLIRTHWAPPAVELAHNLIPSCVQRQTTEGLELAGHCSLRQGLVQLSTQTVAVVALHDSSVQVVRGRLEFSVSPVPAGQPPVRIGLPRGGEILVMGTRFTVDQGGDTGSVALIEGKIRLSYPNQPPLVMKPGDVQALPGATARLEAPQTLPVPLTTATAADGASRAVALRVSASDTPQTAFSVQPVNSIERIAGPTVDEQVTQALALRATGRAGAALAALDALDSQTLEPHTAEVLSYERADIIEHSGDIRVACKLWRAHLERFPGGSYEAAVRTRLKRDCAIE